MNIGLFPSQEDRLRVDDILTRLLASTHASVLQGSVAPTFDVTAFRDQLAAFDFEQPRSLTQTLAWTIRPWPAPFDARKLGLPLAPTFLKRAL